MTTQKTNKIQNGYSTTEAKRMLDKYIEESTRRLQKKLQTAWKSRCG